MPFKSLPERTKKERKEIEQQKLLRVVSVLRLLMNQELSVLEVSEKTGISERTVYRYLHVFEHAGFIITRTDTDQFRYKITDPKTSTNE